MNTIVCKGLDGGNPLHMLAALGMMVACEQKGVFQSLYWQRRQVWTPCINISCTESELWPKVCDVIIPRRIWRARQRLENARQKLIMMGKECDRVETLMGIETERKAKRGAKEKLVVTKKSIKHLKKRVEQLEDVREKIGRREVQSLHPLCICGDHLDDITKGGVSTECFRKTATGPSGVALSGYAADILLHDKKKSIIGRSHFSFANNNSNKWLLKDFCTAALYCTPERLRGDLVGSGAPSDFTTGLGWDPASQKPYALQWSNPEDVQTKSQTALNALAFIGLQCLPVIPVQSGRVTVGFNSVNTLPTESQEEVEGKRGKVNEAWTWPIWETPIGGDIIRALLAMEELTGRSVNRDKILRMGIADVQRARRVSFNKRSFFAPAQAL